MPAIVSRVLAMRWCLFRDWSQIKRWCSNRFIRSSVIWIWLVPIAAKLLERVSDTVCIRIFDTALPLRLRLPFSWTCFFLGAVCFAFARLWYIARCPRIVQEYDNFAEFERDKVTTRAFASYLLEVVGTLTVRLSNRSSEARSTTIARFKNQFPAETGSMLPTLLDDDGSVDFESQMQQSLPPDWKRLDGQFAFTYELARVMRRWSRFACCMGFYLGVAFTAVVVLENARFVLLNFVWPFSK